MAYIVSDGNQPLYKTDLTLSADMEAGTVTALGAMVGLVEVGGASGETVAMTLTGRVYADTASTIAAGDKVYVTSANVVTGTALDNTFAGTAVEADTGYVVFELGK
jgi:hypothetical protein